MGLSRLENFLKNARGNILYVSPNDLDSTDSVENRGNSLTRPFKTIQRALIEASRFSYQRGLNNDRFGQTTILLYPGDHVIDNRPGFIPDGVNNYRLRDGSTSSDLPPWDLETVYDLANPDNELYKLNSIHGGVIVPRGTSIVGLDLRKTKVRPKYVPNPDNDNIERSALFRITGACYFWQFTIFDADPNGTCYKDYTDNTFVPNFSHHKLTCFEYADGVNNVSINDAFQTYTSADRTDLDMYYEKVGLVYGTASGREIEPDYPSSALDIEPKIDEFRIVGSTGQEVGITSIRAGDGDTSTTDITVTTATAVTGLDVDTPFRIQGISVDGYDGQFVVAERLSSTQFKYEVQNAPANALPATTGSTVTLQSDTVTSASPYIFNLSLRSVFGMCGMHADGSKATGFKSMVVAQFTGISLQKDDSAFVKYNSTTGIYEDDTVSGNETLSTDSRSIYKPSFSTFHIKCSNNSVIQAVSIFAIGYAEHFVVESGGDMSITNSNSNFGAKALICIGFRNNAFPRDDTGYITHILPPQEITTEEVNLEWEAIDVAKTVSVGQTSRLYLYNQFNANVPPQSVIQGYRIGAKDDDRLKVIININGQPETKEADIVMPDTQGTGNLETVATKEYTVGRTAIGINSITSNIFTLTEPHAFKSGESLRVLSDDGELPDGLNHNRLYYAITAGINTDQLKLAQTLNDTISASAVSVNSKGGILQIQSRVSDKKSGDIAHPVQYDTTQQQWYITVSENTAKNNIYSTIAGLGTAALGEASPRTFISRTPDNRSLEDKVYKVRYVVPRDSSVLGRPPEDSFVLQESGQTVGLTNNEISKFKSVNPVILSNSSELRNPRLISNAVWDATTGIATVHTEVAHELSIGSKVQVFNVVSTANTTGLGNTGFNGVYSVTSRPDRKSFTVGINTNPGQFDTNTDLRTTDLPRFERKNLNNTLFVYKKEEVQEYIPNAKDGVYHLTLIDSSSQPVVTPFQNLRYQQPLKNLYPQLDRDNPISDPEQTRTFALPTPLGLTEVNDPQKNLTKEVINKNIRDIKVGFDVADVLSQSGTAHTITTLGDHGFNAITKVGVTSTGLNYGNGSGSIQTLYNAQLVGFGASVTGKFATANVQIDVDGAITDVKIVDGGSAYGIGNTLAVTGVGSTGGFVQGFVTVEAVHNSVGDVIRLDGIRDERFVDYNNVYTITGVTVGDDVNVNVSSASTVFARFPFTEPSAVTGINTNGLSNISAAILSDVTAYMTGRSIGITSITYNNTTGIASVTCDNSHGMLVGNNIKFGGFAEDLLNGDFTVDTVYSVNSLSVNIGVGTTTITGFDNGTAGQIIHVILNDTNTDFTNGTNLKLFRGLDYTSGQTNDISSFVCKDGTTWLELNRQDNS